MEIDLVKRLKADLLLEEFAHGQWLRLNELEKRYAVSRTEVRKALTALAAVGALQHVENHGYRVPTADPEKDAHHREARLVLELGAAPKVFYRATISDLARLHGLAKQFESAVMKSSLEDVQTLNDKFHREFFALCGNPVLADLIDEMRELLRPYSTRHPYSTNEKRKKSAEEHFEMLDCIEKKNLPGLLDVMRRHLFRDSIASSLVDTETRAALDEFGGDPDTAQSVVQLR